MMCQMRKKVKDFGVIFGVLKKTLPRGKMADRFEN